MYKCKYCNYETNNHWDIALSHGCCVKCAYEKKLVTREYVNEKIRKSIKYLDPITWLEEK